jgi:hypothetical protein
VFKKPACILKLQHLFVHLNSLDACPRYGVANVAFASQILG